MAGLRKMAIPLTFQTGVDTGSDPKVTGQTLLKAEDAVFPRKGAVGKRRGTRSLAGTHAEQHMATYKDRPVAFEHELLVEDGADITSGAFSSVDTMSLWDVSLNRTQTPEGEQRFNAEVLEVGLVRTWAYAVHEPVGGTYDIHIETFERYNGRPLANTIISGPSAGNNPQCRLVNLNGALYYLYVSTTRIWLGSVNVTTGAIAGAVDTGVLLFSNNQQFDAVAVSTTHIMACGRDSTGNNLRVASLDIGGASYAGVNFAAVDVDAVGIWQRQTDEAVICYFLGTGRDLRFIAYDISLAAPTVADTRLRLLPANTVAYNITGINATPDTAQVFYTQDETVHSLVLVEPRVYRAELNLPGPAVTSDAVICNKAVVASKPLDDTADSGDVFLWITYETQSYAYLLDGAGNHRGKAFPALAEGSNAAEPVATWFIATMDSASTALRYKPTVGDTRAPAMVTIARPANGVLTLEAQDQLQIPTSLPVQFDGESITELGFLHVPDVVSGAAAGGGNLSAGDYLGIVVYEDRDTGNRLHQSSPSLPSATVTSGATGTITWTIPFLTHTLRENVTVTLWRTNAGGSTYYRHPSVNEPNNTALDQFTFDDGSVAADDDLSAEARLYTDGNVLANTQPPSGHVQGEHQGRLFIVDNESPETRVRYSKPYAEGIGVEHADLLYLDAPPEGGDITAIHSFMGRLLVFKADRVYAYGGKGFTNTLLGPGYGDPYLISEAVGCTKQKTMALIPGGLMFQGAARLWLIDKGFRVQSIGDAVRYWTDPITRRPSGALDLRAAVKLPELSIVVYVTDDMALVYNYLYGQWATWTGHVSTDATEAADHLFFKAPSDDTIRIRDVATFLDGATPVTLTVETGWLSFAGLLGYKRVYRAMFGGQNITSHTLRIRIMYDLEPEWIDDLTFDSSTLTRFGSEAHMGDGLSSYEGMGYQVGANPSRQKCTSIRFQFSDDDQTGSNESYDLTALTFEVGIKSGTVVRRGSRRKASP